MDQEVALPPLLPLLSGRPSLSLDGVTHLLRWAWLDGPSLRYIRLGFHTEVVLVHMVEPGSLGRLPGLVLESALLFMLLPGLALAFAGLV